MGPFFEGAPQTQHRYPMNAAHLGFNVNAEDLRSNNWQPPMAAHSRKECWSFYDLFATLGQQCEANGDDSGCRTFELLRAVASFHPDYDSKGNPFGPSVRMSNGRRSMMAEDLTKEDLAALRGILEEISDPEFRARVGDVLWETTRDYKAAQVAVEALLASAERLKTDDLWPPYFERLERAADLSAKLGFGKLLHQRVITAIEAAIQEFVENLKAGRLCQRLMLLALNHGVSNLEGYAALAESLALAYGEAGDADVSHCYWEVASRYFRKAKNEPEEMRCRLSAGETTIAAVEKSLREGKLGIGNAAYWLGQAVEELRQAHADPARINEIHRRFLELQQKALDELDTVDPHVEGIPGFRETEQQTQSAAEAHVSGRSFEDAVTHFVHVTKPTDVVALRQQIEQRSETFSWEQFIDTSVLDYSGKVADKLPASAFAAADEAEAALLKRMVLTARQIHWQIVVIWKIDPARAVIFREHPVRQPDLLYLVLKNPFVPPGHEEIYVRGFQAGFSGDWLVAMHLLIPQVEASIRHVFQQHGIVTSTLDGDGLQKERDLNQLLWMAELEMIFGPDMSFDLRGILIDRFGYNMRNESAHGLMPTGSFYHHSSIYLWWLLLHICWNRRMPAK
jgi:hypothetical protein